MLQVIHNVRLIDGTGGPPLENAAIVIDGEKFVAAGRESQLWNSSEYQAAERTIDAAGKTAVPGLINAHEHITWRRSYGSWAARVVAKDPSWLLARGTGHCLISLREGVTTVRDVGSKGDTAVALKRAIEDGLIIGPRMMVCRQTIAMTGGHAYQAARVADGPDEVRKAVREQLLQGADLIKLMGSGGTGIFKTRDFPWTPQFTLDEMRAAFDEAHSAGKKTTIHCHPPDQIRRAVDAGVDCIEHGGLIDVETAELLASKAIPLVPTLVASRSLIDMGEAYGRDPETIERVKSQWPATIERWSRILETGVMLVAGVDSLGDLNMELQLLTEIGMMPMQAIQSATQLAAVTLDIGDEVGTVEPGKYADLVVVDDDPLADIDNLKKIEWVMKGGDVYTPSELSKLIGHNLEA